MAYYDRKWNDMFDNFREMFPTIAEKVIDWWPSGREEITVRLSNGSSMVWRDVDRSARNVRVSVDGLTEELWRKNFSYKLRDALASSGKTSQDVADEIGISRQMFSRYLNSRATPSYFVLDKLARVLRCTISDLTEVVEIE